MKQSIFGTDNKALMNKIYTRASFPSFIKNQGKLYTCKEKIYKYRQYSFWIEANLACGKIYLSLVCHALPA